MKIKTLISKDIKSLMGDQSSYYYIPDYQRPYSWDEENVTDFWEDITKAYENDEETYFLGSFILIENPNVKGFEVVDGQQRLSTITLFLSVIRDILAIDGEKEIADKLQNEFIKGDGKYRLTTRTSDRISFEKNVLENVGSLKKYDSSKMRKEFKNAIDYFYRLIEAKKRDREHRDEKITDYLKSVVDFFLNKVVVIIVVTEDIASAYTIFETINQRGKELRTEDLLKNYLLKKLKDEITKHNKQYPKALKDFDDEKQAMLSIWQSIENSGEKMENLLNYHRTALLGTNPKKDLFKEITSYIRDFNIDVHSFLVDWQKTVEAYHSLSRGEEYDEQSDKTKKLLSLLWEINHAHWISILIAARRNNWSIIDFEELVFSLEKMYALFWVAGYNAVKVKYPSWNIVREYINQSKSLNDVKKYIKEVMKNNRVYRRFYEAIQDDCYGRSWCKYVLAKYEYALSDEAVIKKIKFDKTVQIEHILPQTMTEPYWKKRFSTEDQRRLVNKIGNLTLLIGGIKEKNKSKNQTAANKSFDDKIKVYTGIKLDDGLSAFQMTLNLEKYKEWNAQAIADRQKKITETLKQVWETTEKDIEPEEFIDEAFPSFKKGEYIQDDLEERLKETLQRESPLTCRFIGFLEILLSENRAFTREEIKQGLYAQGIGDTIGRTGTFLSNISQFLTKPANSHLRQIITFEGADKPGELKDNYKIADSYRQLLQRVLNEIKK